ncbi:DUF4438 domain-containing protein [bacterium]|nr:MAG: DUF4438 domain-containing protein [bacterium]
MPVPKTNADKLIKMSVQGHPSPPEHYGRHGFDADGQPFLLPGTGGIVYNVHIGDPAFGWEADHLEPAVSAVADQKERSSALNAGFNFYSCTGNEAVIISGDAKGDKGVVIGHHGGSERVIIEFGEETMEKMTLEDKILIRGFGQGLKFIDYPDIAVYNFDPNLIEPLGIEDGKNGIIVPVCAKVPGQLMGSGVGSTSMGRSDYDIMTADKEYIKELKLDKLRFGDFVAITDHDNRYGRSYRRGATTIGIVVHGDCRWAGHGPGITTLISSVIPGKIEPVISSDANIGKILGIGRFKN